MFKGHPKSLYVLFFSNMGERFGYYTMLAIFTLFLQDRFGWNETQASDLYGKFLAGVYFAPLLGGFIADRFLGYGKTITLGIIIKILGYALLARPIGEGLTSIYIALGTIALGTGLFKGNLVVILGNLYEKENLKPLQSAAFNLFYMGINIGAMFAPFVAIALKNWCMSGDGFVYDNAIPRIANDLLAGKTLSIEAQSKLTTFAQQAHFTDIHLFSQKYIASLSQGYHYGFGFAIITMIVSMAIFLGYRKYYKEADYSSHKREDFTTETITPEQSRSRVFALLLVFVIVIFFWMAFNQNGASFTFFAKNYTNLNVGKFTFMLFSLPNLIAIFGVILGIIFLINKQIKGVMKVVGGGLIVLALAYLGYELMNANEVNRIDPEIFQAFNPIFVIWLTPVIVGFFTYLAQKGKEPSAPLKIGIGMLIATVGYLLMIWASIGLPSVHQIGGNAVSSNLAVTPYWLVSTYFMLTVAELFLSPMGLAFVAKVAPPKLKGLMQGGWLAATAAGNYLAGYIGRFYQNWELWQFFTFVVILCLLSSLIMFSLLRVINKAAQA